MAPINEPGSAGAPNCNGISDNNGPTPEENNSEPHKFSFPSHQLHMVNLAKMCQENKQYADCVIRVGEDELKCHRLVLGAVSPFLKLVFGEIPATLPEATILVPGVKKSVVKSLLDFFYTGSMTIDRQDTSDLQLLIDTLKIDPGLITVDALPRNNSDHVAKEEDEEKDKPELSSSSACISKEENHDEKISEDVEKKTPPTPTIASSSSAQDKNDSTFEVGGRLTRKRKASAAANSDEKDDEESAIAHKKSMNSHH